MGFSANRTWKLDFSGDPGYEGLEVEALGATFGEVLDLREFDEIRMANGIFPPEQRELVERMYRVLIGKIVRWNLTDQDGGDLPVVHSALPLIDADVLMTIWNAWLRRVTGMVPRPLGETSTSGDTSGVESLPMEPLSESHGS